MKIASFIAAAVLTSSIASAQHIQKEESPGHRLYLSAALGFNSPSGAVGGEADFRVLPLMSVGLGMGTGLWGFRISPNVKLDWAVDRQSTIFLEAALSGNLGTKGYTEMNDVRQDYQQDFMLSGTLSVGGRFVSRGPFFTGARFGYALPLTKNSFRTADGSAPTELTQSYLDFASQGGIVAAVTTGMAF